MPVLPPLLLLGAAAVVLAIWSQSSSSSGTRAPAGENVAPGASGEDEVSEARWSEAEKLAATDPALRNKLVRILAALRREFGEAEIRLFFTWRSPETQLQRFNEGRTRLKVSKHNANDANGNPAARAADIVHRTGWDSPQAKQVFRRLGELAEAEGLVWGGRWTDPYDPAHVELP